MSDLKNSAPPHEAPQPAPGARLRSYVDRIERLEEEKKALASDIKDILVEVKAAGFDTKVFRRLLRERKIEPAELEEQQALLELYRNALDGLKSL
jgi:uncharacterized protein (UPF0335 family)